MGPKPIDQWLHDRANWPYVMGVINVADDSFWAPSRAQTAASALGLAQQMVTAGVDIIDIGGEATNPGINLEQQQIGVQQELARVIPAIEAIRHKFDVKISVDTSKPEVMHAAVAAGADMINDQRALSLPGAISVARDLAVPVCLMHMYQPGQRANAGFSSDGIAVIKDYLLERASKCQDAGIMAQRLVLDPGFGGGNFGKTTDDNLALLRRLDEFANTSYPILAGFSRKGMVGDITGKAYDQRLYGSVACAVLAAERGVAMLRVHDVGATVDAIKMVKAIRT